MIDALIAGRLRGVPTLRTVANGRTFAIFRSTTQAYIFWCRALHSMRRQLNPCSALNWVIASPSQARLYFQPGMAVTAPYAAG